MITMGKLNMLTEQMSGVFGCLKGRCLWLFLYRAIFAKFIESDGMFKHPDSNSHNISPVNVITGPGCPKGR